MWKPFCLRAEKKFLFSFNVSFICITYFSFFCYILFFNTLSLYIYIFIHIKRERRTGEKKKESSINFKKREKGSKMLDKVMDIQ